MSAGSKHKPRFKRIAQIKTALDFKAHLENSGIELEFDHELLEPSPFAKKFTLSGGFTIGNRFCILPMEGWDGTREGDPTDYTKRRWKNFGISGAKLLWGCEAVAVRYEGRANPHQLVIHDKNVKEFKSLFDLVTNSHADKYGNHDDLLVGLQLTHSGRYSKPNLQDKMEPKILYHHPLLDQRVGLTPDYPIMKDEEIDGLVEDFVRAAKRAQSAGFHFVDIKHCHGYLGHEFLSAFDRKGKYGGSFENRTAFLRHVVEGIRSEVPGLQIGVRLSAFDFIPFGKDQEGIGVAEKWKGHYPYAFGGDGTGLSINLSETMAFLKMLESLSIELVCITGGSPYYNPHIQRPALFPPSDGYLPPEDPLAGVTRQIQITRKIKEVFPGLAVVGSAYSYLQDWLPHVGQQVLRTGGADFIGLGRMVLSYPEMPDDILNHRPLKRNKICRTFSDCTTAPRNGMISGCFPLDPFYKALPEGARLKVIKGE